MFRGDLGQFWVFRDNWESFCVQGDWESFWVFRGNWESLREIGRASCRERV